MPNKLSYDAVVVGSGPNGLSAAIRLAQAGLSVLVLEANETIGGGIRSAELTLPGFIHDVCSAIHPLGIGSPFFRQLPLEKYGLSWIHPEFPLAHPLDGVAAVLERSVANTAEGLGKCWFSEEPASALFAGLAGHSFLRLEQRPSAAFGLVLGMLGHSVGWPLPRGGSQQMANALAAHLRALGGEIRTSTRVENIH